MARTKMTGKPKPNGTPKAYPPKSPDLPASVPIVMKSPAQPAELSDADRQKMKEWLDKQERAFTITTAPLSRKRKRQSSTLQLQTDLFDPRLDIQYEVKPRQSWELLRRYKKFTVGAESIAVGQCVLVKHDDSEEAKIDLAAQWKGKVLEVRALDSEHVYLRVAWLNRPEDLPGGRKAYHGKNELIPTNQMDVIDAMAVNGSLEVKHWEEQDDESDLMAEDQYFWRQTLDYGNTKTFSKLRQICVDEAPQNPDEMIIQCGNKDCRKWLHVKCIAEAAVQEAAGAKMATKSKKKIKPTPVPVDKKSSAVAIAEQNSLRAEVFIEGTPEGGRSVPAKATEIIVTTAEGEKQSKDVCCLFCKSEIE